MNLLTDEITKFMKQKGIVKDAVARKIFGSKFHIVTRTKDYRIDLYREGNMIIGIRPDLAYVCRWNGDYTISIFRFKNVCNVKLRKETKLYKSFDLLTSGPITFFTMLMDLIEIENVVRYSILHNGRLKVFIF